MSKTLLYYPSINIPNKNWAINSILYADKISTILPFDNMNDDRISSILKELYAEGIYEPFFIENELSENRKLKQNLKFFENEFISTIKSNEFKQFKRNYLRTNNRKMEDSLIYKNKLTDNVKDFLKNENLLQVSSQEEVFVDRFASVYYLCKLSQFLSSSNNNYTVPCTDNFEFEDICFTPNIKTKSSSALRIRINECLPSIDENTPIKKIIKFKKKRESDLLNFNNEITDVINDIAKLPVDEHDSQIEKFNNRIRSVQLEMKKLFKSDWKTYLYRSLSSLLHSLPIVIEASKYQAIPSSISSPVIMITYTTISTLLSNSNSDSKDKTLSYVHYVNKKFKTK
ncbi:MAG TPA: DUF6236 family protein [Ignavibacteria bacterium]|nr:DUF6236 family protein [Ignavibacteria bacterium]HMQ99052.1 DUF6236 family protein [Ignavibacteria bacterium]